MVEQPDDWWDVEALFDLAFAPGREALSSYRLRNGVEPVSDLCLVARDDLGIVGGAIRFWPVCIGVQEALLLGPIAVHPTRQGEGLGRVLIEEGLGRAKGWDRVMLIGDAPYYSRFGFRKLVDVDMPHPTNPERVLGRELATGAWHGITGRVVAWSPKPTGG